MKKLTIFLLLILIVFSLGTAYLGWQYYQSKYLSVRKGVSSLEQQYSSASTWAKEMALKYPFDINLQSGVQISPAFSDQVWIFGDLIKLDNEVIFITTSSGRVEANYNSETNFVISEDSIESLQLGEAKDFEIGSKILVVAKQINGKILVTEVHKVIPNEP